MTSKIIPIPLVLLNLESVERKGKFEYLENVKSFFDEIKKHFWSFGRTSI